MLIRAPADRTPAELRRLLEEGHYESAGSIRSTCDSISRWLGKNQDNVRDFFRECYRPLLNCVLGLERIGWLSLVEGRTADRDALMELLKPDGHLFRAMREVDTEGLNHYQLPCKMLVAHTQALMSTPAGMVHHVRRARPFAQVATGPHLAH